MDKVLNFLSFSPGPSYTITGTYSYYLEVSIKGDSPYQTSTISLTAFTKSDKKIAIAISCKWYRVLGDRQYRLTSYNSNAYQLSAEDLGSTLKIEVTSQEEDQKGSAIVHYGPIRLDPNVRSTLENILGAGGSRFPVQIVDEETGAISRESAALSLTSEYIRIVETPAVGKEREIKFKYNYDVPKVELNYLDGTRMYFLFTGDEDDCGEVRKFIGVKKGTGCKLGAKFLSRTARDLVLLTIKCFATKNYLMNSMLINEVMFQPGKIFKDKKDAPQEIGDTLLEVDSIKREMYSVLWRNQELTKDKERLQVSVKRLEEELSSTIETYSQLINDLRANSDMSLAPEGAGEYRNRNEALEEEVKKLKRRVQEMEDDKVLESQADRTGERRSERPRRTVSNKDNDDLANIRQDFQTLSGKKGEANLFSLEYEMKMHDLEEEIEKLRAKNDDLQDELRHVKGRGSVQSEMPRSSTRGTRQSVNDESFVVIENKLSDTKRLNELLIKQVNDFKAKNSSLRKEVDMLRAEVANLREGNSNEHQVKEDLYKQEKEALEKEVQRLKGENVKLQKGQGYEEQHNAQFSEKMEALYKENIELKEKMKLLERQLQGYNSVNVSQSGSAFSTPVKRVGESFDSGNRGVVDEMFMMRVKTDMDAIARDAMNWKGRCTNLEIEFDKMRRENSEMRARLMQGDTLSSSGVMSSGNKNNDFLSYVDKSVLNTSRTFEALLADSKRENDRLYAEVSSLKTKLMTTEFALQSARGDLERAKSSVSVPFGMESEISKVRKDAEIYKEEVERLRSEVAALRMSASKQMSTEDRERILRERDQLRGELESLKKAKGNQGETEEKVRELEWKLNERSREIEALKAELLNAKTKNVSLAKEIDYLREEVKSGKMKDESMLIVEVEYKEKYERLQQQYKKLEKELNTLKAKVANTQNENIESYEDLQQMNELLRKEILDYKKKVGEVEQGSRKSVRESNTTNTVDEELRKRTKTLEVEMQNQRSRIADLEKENERLRLTGSTRESSTHDDSFFLGKDTSGIKMKGEVEKLKNENESLVLQRNQLSKKVESLAKELESKVGIKTNQAMLDNLAKTNEKLIQENARLMEELDSVRCGDSRMDNSRFFEDNDRGVRELQQELTSVTSERDQLLVQVSKMKAMEKNRGLFS